MKGKIFFIIFVCINILIILLTCRGVLYDEDITSTLFTASKMNLETTIGPIRFYEECIYANDEVNIWYLPEKGMFDNGYIIRERESEFKLWYYNGENSDNMPSSPINGYEQNNYPWIFFEPIMGYPGNLFVIKYNDPELYNILKYDEVNHTLSFHNNDLPLENEEIFTDFSSTFSWTDPNGVDFKGAFISPVDNRLYLSCYYCDSEICNRYYTVSYDIAPETGGDPLTNGFSEYGNSSVNLENNFADSYYFFYDVSQNMSIISVSEGDSYNAYYWDETLVKNEIMSKSNPVTNLFTSSELLVLEGKNAVVYGIDGGSNFQFFSGDLKFNYEYYNGSRYLSVFTYTYAYYHDDCHETEFYFNVYSIPTNELSDLGYK